MIAQPGLSPDAVPVRDVGRSDRIAALFEEKEKPVVKLRSYRSLVWILVVIFAAAGAGGCASQSNAAQGAGKGATTGAVAGAVGGMVTALVFGGNVAEAGARGAVYGGASGAVVGGIAGAEVDRAEEQARIAKREAEMQELKKRIGPDAYNGVIALAECKHAVAIANANVAIDSGKNDYELAGVWIKVLANADQEMDDEARALYPEIMRRDRDLKTAADVDDGLGEAMQRLQEIRVEHDMPKACPA